jgi:hypothetical protein
MRACNFDNFHLIREHVNKFDLEIAREAMEIRFGRVVSVDEAKHQTTVSNSCKHLKVSKKQEIS